MPSQKDLLLRRVVVSGPIGSGKSEVGKMLARRGAFVIEADRIGHAVLEPGAEAYEAVAVRWPNAVVDGRIDRAALASVVFADPTELAELERITHPHIGKRIEAAVHAAGEAIVVVELPLTATMLGDTWHRLVVLAADDVRLRRSVERGMAEGDVRRRMAAQAPFDVWEASADSVIVNEGERPDLERSVKEWWRRHVEP